MFFESSRTIGYSGCAKQWLAGWLWEIAASVVHTQVRRRGNLDRRKKWRIWKNGKVWAIGPIHHQMGPMGFPIGFPPPPPAHQEEILLTAWCAKFATSVCIDGATLVMGGTQNPRLSGTALTRVGGAPAWLVLLLPHLLVHLWVVRHGGEDPRQPS